LNEAFESFGYWLLNGRSENDKPAKFTYIGPSGRSVIDVAWVNENALPEILNFEIAYMGHVSDHFPCRVQLAFNGPQFDREAASPQAITSFKWDPNKAEQYQEILNEKLTATDNEVTLLHLLKSVHDTASALGMKKQYSQTNNCGMRENRKNFWFNNECKIAKKELRKLSKAMRKNNSENTLFDRYRLLRKKYLLLLKETRNQYEIGIRNRLANVKSNIDFWSTIKQLKPKKPNDNPIKPEIWQEY
jgi:hypothetical protein